MSAQLKDPRAEHIYALVEARAKRKGSGVKKLDRSAREIVINGAAWRLILNQRKYGNIRDYQDVDGDVSSNKLGWRTLRGLLRMLPDCDRALDAERKAYLRASAASGGTPAGEAVDYSALESLDRHTEEGNVTEPEQQIEREELEAEEAAAEDARAKIEAEENERLRLARNAYGETLDNIRHRRALYLICADPSASNSMIAAQVGLRSVKGIKPETVSKIRDKLTEIADEILTIPEGVIDTLLREVERLKQDVAALRAERRRDSWLKIMTPEEFTAARSSTFWAEAAENFGTTIDRLLGAPITTDALLSASIVPKECDQ
jgi:hypothetical protein